MVYSINIRSRTDMSIAEIEPRVESSRDDMPYQSVVCNLLKWILKMHELFQRVKDLLKTV